MMLRTTVPVLAFLTSSVIPPVAMAAFLNEGESLRIEFDGTDFEFIEPDTQQQVILAASLGP